jgi:hypothetical protein
MGGNAVRVYNAQPPGYDQGPGTMVNFLNAAWNGGSQPVYAVFTIYFTGDKLLNSGAVTALSQQYYALAKYYAQYPAVLGVTIGNEIGAANYLSNPAWWQGVNALATAAKNGFRDGGDANKLVMMAEADGNIGAVIAGEQNHVALDAWGVNVYRGRTLTNLVSQLQGATTKPVLLTEWGMPASYHPSSNAVYNRNSDGTAYCTYPRITPTTLRMSRTRSTRLIKATRFSRAASTSNGRMSGGNRMQIRASTRRRSRAASRCRTATTRAASTTRPGSV